MIAELDITPQVRSDYLRYKFQLKNGLEQAISAIKHIRDERLYRVEYKTFEDFCQAELEEHRRKIDRLIVQENVNQDLSQIGLKVVESQAQILNQLTDPEDKQVAVRLAQL